MATKKDQWVEAVAKLIKLTQEGKLTWSQQFKSGDVAAGLKLVYIARYKDYILRLYDTGTELDRAFNGPSATLEFTDEKGNTLWTYPNVESLNHLLLSVEFQVANVKDFLKEILSEA